MCRTPPSWSPASPPPSLLRCLPKLSTVGGCVHEGLGASAALGCGLTASCHRRSCECAFQVGAERRDQIDRLRSRERNGRQELNPGLLTVSTLQVHGNRLGESLCSGGACPSRCSACVDVESCDLHGVAWATHPIRLIVGTKTDHDRLAPCGFESEADVLLVLTFMLDSVDLQDQPPCCWGMSPYQGSIDKN